jgi:hypothetical protein
MSQSYRSEVETWDWEMAWMRCVVSYFILNYQEPDVSRTSLVHSLHYNGRHCVPKLAAVKVLLGECVRSM